MQLGGRGFDAGAADDQFYVVFVACVVKAVAIQRTFAEPFFHAVDVVGDDFFCHLVIGVEQVGLFFFLAPRPLMWIL